MPVAPQSIAKKMAIQLETAHGIVAERGDTQCSGHVGARRSPRENRLPHCRGVLDRPREVLRVQAPANVLIAQHLAGDEEGDLPVGGDADRREARDDRGEDEAESRADRLEDPGDEDVEGARDRHDAGEADRAEADEQDTHHRVHPAAVEETAHVLDDGGGVEARLADHIDLEAVDPGDDGVLEAHVLEDDGVDHGAGRGDQHDGDRRLLPDGAAQDDDDRNQQQDVPVEGGVEGAQDRPHLLGNGPPWDWRPKTV